MNRNVDKFINAKGDFEFPNYLYHNINSLMKSILDLGTLACTDDRQLRAFKETVKKSFKAKWQEIASLLEEFDFISPCVCTDTEYCTICGGSRFVTNELFNSDEIEETTIITTSKANQEIQEKLRTGLTKAIAEVRNLNADTLHQKRVDDEGN